MPDRDLLVRILGDDRDLQQAIRNTDRSLERIDTRTKAFSRNIGRAFAAAGIAIGAREVFQGLDAAVDAASAVNEEIAKSEQVFGSSSIAIEAWSETTARAIGVSQREALAASGTFGNLFATVELGQDVAAGMSQSLVELAADLASFNNADISDVLAAIRSGLIGEAEPLRRFGVLLSESRVQLAAMAATGKDSAKELTNQEKALARYNIILQDTAVAQGDFTRTQDGLANQTRILEAQLEDLQAEFGRKLLPTMLAVTQAAIDLIDVFSQAGDTFKGIEGLGDTIESIDVSQLVAVRDRLREIGDDGDRDILILDQIIERLKAIQGIVVGGPDSRGGPRGPGAIAASNARVDAQNELEAAKKAKTELEKTRKEFRELTKGLGLKLDKAGFTAGLDDDISALRELERAILRQMEREGKTFDLVQQLTQTRLDIAALVERQAADAKQAGEDAFNATIDALNLDLEIAQSTKSLKDDESALRAIERAILARITVEGQTTDLLRQLFQVRQEQAEVARRIAEQKREQRQNRQFGALGLTEEGERPTPGVGALRRRLKALREQVKGTALDTDKTRAELDKIAKVLSGKFGAVGKEVREAILQMFNDIAGAFEEGSGAKGPLTKTSGLNTKKIIEGLGLSPEEANEIRARLSGFNTGGRALAAVQSQTPGGRTSTSGGTTPSVNVENNVTVQIDGYRLTATVTKQQQKIRRRNPRQKRGPNRNI